MLFLSYFKKDESTTQMQKIYAVYGEGSANNWMCQNWFGQFHIENYLLKDPLIPVRPVTLK